MAVVWPAASQLGLPDIVPDLVGIAGTIVLLLIVVALAAVVYRSLTGGIDWPDEANGQTDPEASAPPDSQTDSGTTTDELREGGADDEWDYY